MKTGPQMNTLLQNLQVKLEDQSSVTERQTQRLLTDFENSLTQQLNDVQKKIVQDLRDLEKMSNQVRDRTANQIEEQARAIRKSIAALEESRKVWRTVTWKTMLTPYLAGVLLTFWVLMLAAQLTFPQPKAETAKSGLATFGLAGSKVTRGLGGLGRVLSLPQGVELADCPIPNPGGSGICIKTEATR